MCCLFCHDTVTCSVLFMKIIASCLRVTGLLDMRDLAGLGDVAGMLVDQGKI